MDCNAMQQRVYFYKLVVDDGGAPCVQNGLLSLAICKPQIRKTASVAAWFRSSTWSCRLVAITSWFEIARRGLRIRL
jgi:hypothetical protein